MTYFKQTDPRWSATKIWGTQLTLGSFGCFITSLGNLCGKTPPEVNQILGSDGCIVNGLITTPTKVAALLGLEYLGIAYSNPGYDCIAETWDFDKIATPEREQHFFNVFPDGRIFDPLGLRSSYNIKSYRLYRRNMGRIIWDNVEVVFTQGQVNEMSSMFEVPHAYTGNESWGWIQECEQKVQAKYGEFRGKINELVDSNAQKSSEIARLNIDLSEYAHNEEILHDEIDARQTEIKTLQDEIAKLHKIWDGHVCETKELSIQDHLHAIIGYVQQLFKRK